MGIVRMAGWLVAAVLATVVSLASFSINYEVRAPARAYVTGFPPSGIARGNLAVALYKSQSLKVPNAEVAAAERDQARLAYQAEPLSSNALALLVKAMGAGANRPKGQLLLDLAGKLTRRNSLLSSEQIKSAAERDDQASFFLWMSRSVLTNNDLRNAYVGAMATITERDGAVAALTPILGNSPKWADYYWKQVAQRPPSLTNAANLRIAVSRPPWRQSVITDNDKGLTMALSNSGQFDIAHKLVQVLEKLSASRRGNGNLLANGNFSHQPQLPPFDWKLSALGNLGASIDQKDNSLLVSAIGGANGMAASQLVQLSPGPYSLGWTLATNAQIDESTLSVRVYCAETGAKSQNPIPVPLVVGRRKSQVNIADSACRWYWIGLYVSLADDSSGIDAYFRDISLTRAVPEK